MRWIKAAYRRGMGWYHASLLPRFVLSIALAGCLFILVAVIFVTQYFNPALTRSVEQVERDYLSVQAGNVRSHMRACRNLVYECVIDPMVLRYAIDYQLSAPGDRAYVSQRLHDVMRDHLSDLSDAVAYTIYMPDGSYTYYNKLKGATVGFGWFGWAMGQDHYPELKALCEKTNRLGVMQVDVAPRDSSTGAMRFFHLAYPLRDLYSHKRYGVVVLSFDASELGKLVNPTRAAGGESASYGILTNADDLVLAHPDLDAIGRTLSEEEGEDHLVLPRGAITLKQPVNALNLTLMRVVDRSVLLEDANRYTQRMALVLIVLTALFVLGVGGMVQRIIRSIRRLKAGLEQVEAGNLDALVRTRQVNEIGQIIASFNRMTARLKQMGLEREQESQRAIQAMDNLRAAEIRALESQIDSHFLHNTLSTISYTAMHAGDHDASRQIQHLSKMLRYTFERSTGVVPVQEEADWLRDYLELQRLRFGSAIDYKIIIHPDVARWPVHKLILQPFVENSLLHGLENGLCGGVIEVRIAPFDEKRIRVTIRDKGCRGMPPEQVARLNQLFSSCEAENAGEGIGLENAALRIRSYYGGGARVIFRSWLGVGTAVTLILPRALPNSPSARAEIKGTKLDS